MRKWTVRLPDDESDIFAEFCRVSGISVQAALASAVITTNQRFIENDRKPMDQWQPLVADPERSRRWLESVEIARNLDAENRRRAPKDTSS